MQKISSYLYPNRIELLADLASTATEYTNVYQRTVKIYKGVDNVIEFDIKNADQKRLELNTSPSITGILMNVMDLAGNALPNSPYTVTPSVSVKGIATAVIPSTDLENLDPQSLSYSVVATKDSYTIPLYADSKFGAVGKIDLVGTAMPVSRKETVYDRFSGEINFMGNVINHSSAIPTKTYEAIATQTMSFSIDITDFVGTIYIEGTEDSTISVESFRHSPKIQTFNTTVKTTTTVSFTDVNIGSYNYLRVSWLYPSIGMGATNYTNPFGTVDKITVN
jgi:hypothetical protein